MLPGKVTYVGTPFRLRTAKYPEIKAFTKSKVYAAIPFPFTFKKGMRSNPAKGISINAASRLMKQH
jgi:hypothetical protein